ncbi:class I SAM-dependent methyltransferase [Acidilobus sp.]|uniref:class I SAM-dependent methyltransferase n=1 Tax=Acidilobus sp. TaxID=1872109 RepID=UPI003D01E817
MSPVDASLLEPLRLQPGMTVVDLGSGPGRFTIPVAKIVTPGKVYAVDIDKESIRIVAERASEEGLSNVEVIEADVIQGVGLPDNVADVVIMANVLHDFIHEGVSQAALGTAVRLLKSGGRLAVYEFKREALSFGPPSVVQGVP